MDFPQRRFALPFEMGVEDEFTVKSDAIWPQKRVILDWKMTVLLLAADWIYSFAKDHENDCIYPSLLSLADALINSLLDCPPGQGILRNRLAVYIAALYDYTLALKERSFADQLVYEHRRYHYDVLAGMFHASTPFIKHQRRIRQELREGKRSLEECPADRKNDICFDLPSARPAISKETRSKDQGSHHPGMSTGTNLMIVAAVGCIVLLSIRKIGWIRVPTGTGGI